MLCMLFVHVTLLLCWRPWRLHRRCSALWTLSSLQLCPEPFCYSPDEYFCPASVLLLLPSSPPSMLEQLHGTNSFCSPAALKRRAVSAAVQQLLFQSCFAVLCVASVQQAYCSCWHSNLSSCLTCCLMGSPLTGLLPHLQSATTE